MPRFVFCVVVATLTSGSRAFVLPRGGWGVAARRVAMKASPSTQLPYMVPPEAEALLTSLVAAAAEADQAVLETTVRASFDQLGQREMMAMSARASGTAATTDAAAVAAAPQKAWAQVLDAVESETHRRMSVAKQRLEKLMEAGEINELDRRLGKMVGKCRRSAFTRGRACAVECGGGCGESRHLCAPG